MLEQDRNAYLHALSVCIACIPDEAQLWGLRTELTKLIQANRKSSLNAVISVTQRLRYLGIDVGQNAVVWKVSFAQSTSNNIEECSRFALT